MDDLDQTDPDHNNRLLARMRTTIYRLINDYHGILSLLRHAAKSRALDVKENDGDRASLIKGKHFQSGP